MVNSNSRNSQVVLEFCKKYSFYIRNLKVDGKDFCFSYLFYQGLGSYKVYWRNLYLQEFDYWMLLLWFLFDK